MDAQEKMKVEILKNGGISVTYLFLTIFNRCMETVMVPDDLRVACIVPLIKGKVVRRKCANYRGISIMSIPGKTYGRVLISRVMGSTKE